MQPSIEHAIRQGVTCANRSLPGMVVYAAGWLLLALFLSLLGAMADIPPELLKSTRAAEQAALPGAGGGAGAAATTGGTVVDAGEAATVQEEALVAIFVEWVRGSWPLVLVAMLVLVAGGLWLQGGQIGYVAKVVQGQTVRVADFWVTAARAFRALVVGWLMTMAANATLIGTIGVVFFLIGVMSGVLPNWLLAIVALLFVLGTMAVVAWILVRVAFWFIGIVTDGLGPVAGLKATFRATRRHWWSVFWLLALLTVAFFAVSMIVNFVHVLGATVGGPVGIALDLLSALSQLLANLYISFAATAALVRFYLDSKASAAVPMPALGS